MSHIERNKSGKNIPKTASSQFFAMILNGSEEKNAIQR